MEMTALQTDFAPAEREDCECLLKDARKVLLNPDLKNTLDAMPLIVFVLNSCRQIIYANTLAQTALGVSDLSHLYGVRPGEALNCVHGSETSGGCGTTSSCRECGAVLAILNGLRGIDNTQECMIRTKNNDTMFNLKIKAAPLQLDGKECVIVSAVDISNEKWRKVMERTFFHDVMNLLGGVQGIADVLNDMVPDESKDIKELSKVMLQGSRDVIDEINKQKEIIYAENHDMSVEKVPLHSKQLVEQVAEIYRHHSVARDRSVVVDAISEDKLFLSDSRLLVRTIGNMTKNAFEASDPGESVLVGCRTKDDTVQFYVHNSHYIPEPNQAQIFMRSFSTKGSGRGIGTYSIKLFTEQYLKGRAWFTSSPQQGTTFYIEIPVK